MPIAPIAATPATTKIIDGLFRGATSVRASPSAELLIEIGRAMTARGYESDIALGDDWISCAGSASAVASASTASPTLANRSWIFRAQHFASHSSYSAPSLEPR